MLRTICVMPKLVDKSMIAYYCKKLKLANVLVAGNRVANDERLCVAVTASISSVARVAIKEMCGAVHLLQDPSYHAMDILVVVETVADALQLLQRVDQIGDVYLSGNTGKTAAQCEQQLLAVLQHEQPAVEQLLQQRPNSLLQLGTGQAAIPFAPRWQARCQATPDELCIHRQ